MLGAREGIVGGTVLGALHTVGEWHVCIFMRIICY